MLHVTLWNNEMSSNDNTSSSIAFHDIPWNLVHFQVVYTFVAHQIYIYIYIIHVWIEQGKYFAGDLDIFVW